MKWWNEVFSHGGVPGAAEGTEDARRLPGDAAAVVDRHGLGRQHADRLFFHFPCISHHFKKAFHHISSIFHRRFVSISYDFHLIFTAYLWNRCFLKERWPSRRGRRSAPACAPAPCRPWGPSPLWNRRRLRRFASPNELLFLGASKWVEKKAATARRSSRARRSRAPRSRTSCSWRSS